MPVSALRSKALSHLSRPVPQPRNCALVLPLSPPQDRVSALNPSGAEHAWAAVQISPLLSNEGLGTNPTSLCFLPHVFENGKQKIVKCCKGTSQPLTRCGVHAEAPALHQIVGN